LLLQKCKNSFINFLSRVGVRRVLFYTDSQYLIESMTNWINKWLGNGWLTSDGRPLKHQYYFKELLYFMRNLKVQWVRFFFTFKVSQLFIWKFFFRNTYHRRWIKPISWQRRVLKTIKMIILATIPNVDSGCTVTSVSDRAIARETDSIWIFLYV
jgi:hypothetical protein